MNVLSFIYIFLVCFIVITSHKSVEVLYRRFLAVDIAISSQIEVGYFVRVSRFDIDYTYLSQFILLLVGIMYCNGKKITKHKLVLFCMTFFIFLTNMILLIMYPYKKTIIGGVTWDEFILGHAVRTYARFGIGQLMEYLKAFTFLLNAFIFFICLESLNVEKLILLISKIFKGFILYGVIEAIVNNFIKISLFGRITSKITGTSGYELSQVYLRNGLNCLQGLTKEPSHYVNALFFAYLILLCEKKIHGQKRIWFATIIVLLLLSRAYSSVYIIVTIMFIHYMLEWIKEQKKAILYRIRWVGIFFTIMIGILISFRFMKGNYFLWRTTILLKSLGRILYGNWHSLRYIGSSQIRIISIMESLPILYDRFLIGIGLGTAHLHSAFIMSLISVGAFGFLSWLAFLFGASSFANKKIRLIIISSLVLVNILGSMGNKMLYTSSNFIYLLFGFVYSRENYYFEIRELCNEEIACSNRC